MKVSPHFFNLVRFRFQRIGKGSPTMMKSVKMFKTPCTITSFENWMHVAGSPVQWDDMGTHWKMSPPILVIVNNIMNIATAVDVLVNHGCGNIRLYRLRIDILMKQILMA